MDIKSGEGRQGTTGAGGVGQPAVGGLAACIQDARHAVLVGDEGPEDPERFGDLCARLEAARLRCPRMYREGCLLPFLDELRRLGEEDFTRILRNDPERCGTARLMMDVAHALLQQAEGYAEVATAALQEVVCDLYAGFFSAEDRRGIRLPANHELAPLVLWRIDGPYTWPVEATRTFGFRAAVVALPPSNARAGLLAWPTLSHETAGHDVLRAYSGLRLELSDAIEQKLRNGLPEPYDEILARYWAGRVDETTSDILSILNMGPAAAISLIGYFRALNHAYGDQPFLRCTDGAEDPHPIDILRGWLAAHTVAQLHFSDARAWAAVIDAEVEKDFRRVEVEGEPIPKDIAKLSALLVTTEIAGLSTRALQHHSLASIQNWRERDEDIAQGLRLGLRTVQPLAHRGGMYAAHVVAAAIYEALEDPSWLPTLHARTMAVLHSKHHSNEAWGPLGISYAGDVRRHFVYVHGGAVDRSRS